MRSRSLADYTIDMHEFEVFGSHMGMVRPFQLVLDQYPTIGPDVLAENVSTERPDRALLRLQL